MAVPRWSSWATPAPTCATRQEIADFLGIKTVSYAIRHYVTPLIEAGSLKMTLPDRPGSPRQKYYSA